jgi:acyl CoA:acetate/3-ketoacid CoA transferase alpha subunit
MGTMEADLLVGAGAVKSYSYGGGSLDRFGKLSRVNEAIEKKSVDIKEYSGLSLALRFLAGAMGIPFIPTKALIGTDMLETLIQDKESMQMGVSPFDQEEYLFLCKLQPEYSVIHAQAVDEKGNVVIEGPVWDLETAKAGKKLIVTAERLISNEYIKRHPEKVTISGLYTYAAAVVPAGAYPAATYKVYDYDSKALTQYAKVNQKQETFDAYLNEYILGTKDHNEFIDKMGGLAALNAIRADLAYGYVRKGGTA